MARLPLPLLSSEAEDAQTQQALQITVVEKPTDYTFKKGHHIGLSIQTEINEWSIPKPYPCSSPDCVFVRVLWKQGKTRLILPVVNAPTNPADLFHPPGHH
jgi:hypothetical protein